MLGMGKNTVEIIIAARDRTSAAFAKVNTRMKTMGGATGKLQSSMGGLGSKMSALATSMNPVAIAAGAAAIALATMGGAAIKASLDFEKAYATIRVGTGATGEAFEGLKADFRAVFGDIPGTANAISSALTAMNTTTGASGTVLQDLTKNIMDASRMLGEDGAGNAQAFGEAMKQWQIPVASGVGLMEQFFKITQTTGIGFGELTSAMNAYGPVLQNAGFTAAQSAELFGRLEGSGIAVSRVMPGLNAAFRKWAEEGKKGKEELEGTVGAIKNAKTNMEALTIATDVFGAEGAQRMTTAIRNETFELSSLGEMLKDTEGLIIETSAATLTFGDKLTLLKNKVTTAIAPIGDVITNVLGSALLGLSNAFGALQKIAGLAIDIILIKFKMMHSFLEGLFGPILAALAPLKGSFDGISGSVSKLNIIFNVLSDIVTILTGVAKMLGTVIGNLVARAITPLVAKLQEAGEMLGAFYDKLGPLKSVIEGIKGVAGGVVEGFSNLADSFKEAVPPIEEVDKALEKLAEEGPKAPKAVTDAWALAIKSFQEGTGSYKEAIGGIEEKITTLTEEWMTATDKRKAAIEKEVELLNSEKVTLEELKQTAEDALSSAAKETEEATQKMEEFKVTIGDTTIEFKGMAAEVVKNADAYEKLQKSAQTLIDLDWSTFTEFEAALPRIEAGLGDLESSFVGFKDILEENIDELENVKLAVMDISEIAAPFLEKGFLAGIKAIGDFAGALSDAGGAINTFAGLQDVSIEGCINFSMHVYGMVSALEILERQMEDLVPAFGNMDSLMVSVVENFVWIPGKKETLADEINRIAHAAKDGSGDIEDLWDILEETTKRNVTWFKGEFAAPYIERYKSGGEAVEDITKDFMASEEVLERQLGDTTEALAYQTDQLKKITDALQPYLEFMRTLNELAALSSLSTDDLNNGLNAINDTLINLGTSLSTFDLRPVMESLFGTKIPEGGFTGGVAKGFTDTMQDYQGEFKMLIAYISRLSFAIDSLVFSFNALENVRESVLADETKLKDLFGELVRIMANFSKGMGEEGFAETIATSMELMLKSAAPLISYFQKNNAEVKLFNTTLTTFTTTIKNVVDAMDMLKRMSETVLPEITELEAGFEKVAVATSRFTTAITTSFADVKTEMVELDKEWATHKEGMDKLLESFGDATNTITTLSSEIVTLSASLKELKDMSVLSMRDIDEALKSIPIFLDRFVDALRLNMYDIKEALKDLDVEWQKHAEDMKDTMPSYEASTDAIGKLVGSFVSLHSALKSLSEMGTISSATFDKGFSSLIDSISNFAVSLSKNVDDLIYSLQKLRVVWVENEAVLFPLINDFAIITDNLWGVARNANRMAKEFNDLSKNAGTLEEGFESLIGFINQVVDSTEEFYTPAAAAELAGFIEDVEGVIQSFVDLEVKLKGAMEKIRSEIGSAVDNIEGKISSLSSLSESAYWWGANMMGSYINGIYSMSTTLREALEAHAGMVESYLGTYSNAKTGPLSHLDEWPRNLVQSYSAGIESEMSTLNSSFASMFAGPVSVGAGGGSRTVYLNVTQNIGSRADADYSADALQRVLTRHSVM